MKKTKLLFVCALSALLLSCSTSNGSGQSGDTDEGLTALPSDYASSVRSYLKTLKQARNYTIKEKVSSTLSAETNIIVSTYTSSYYFYSYGDSSYGYVKCQDGIYSIQKKTEDSYVGGEIYRDENGKAYASLWGNSFFYSFADLDDEQLDTIEDGKEKVNIKGKKNKLALLNLLGLDSSYYASVSSLTGDINEDNNLVVTLKFNDPNSTAFITIRATVYDLLSSESEEVEDFLIDGTYYTIADDFGAARSLMKANNYTHNTYSDGKVVGTEYFNPNYYFGYWDSSYAAATGQILVSQGLVLLDHKQDAKGNQYNGCYLLTYSSSTGIVCSLGEAYNESTDLAMVYSYPSLLTAWSNPELFDRAEIEGFDGAFVTTNQYLMENFAALFFLDVSSVSLTSLSIAWFDVFESSNEDCVVSFTLSTSGGSATYAFVNFGSTSIPALESFLGQFTDY